MRLLKGQNTNARNIYGRVVQVDTLDQVTKNFDLTFVLLSTTKTLDKVKAHTAITEASDRLTHRGRGDLSRRCNYVGDHGVDKETGKNLPD